MLLRVNLVPQQPLAERIKKVSPLVLGILVILICAFFYARGTYIKSQITYNDKEINRIKETAGVTELLTRQVAEIEADLTVLKKEYSHLLETVRSTEGIQAEKNYYTTPLRDITTSLPSSIKCNKISFKGRNAVIDAVAINHQDIPLFVNNIKDYGHYSQVSFKDVNKETIQGVNHFNFTLVLGMD